MKIAGSMSVGRIATKHTLGIDGIRQLSKNVDPNLTRDNVILADELRGRTIEEYTNETFQPAIDEYNAKQKRNDRKIKTPYVDWHKNNGNLTQGKMSLAYECVIQIGEHESLGHQYYEASGKKREKIHRWYEKQYSELLKDFKERFPHLKVLYAAIHFDEKDGTPHMHLCFQPQAVCTRGLGLQVSIGKALGQDGIPRFENRLEAEREGYQMGRMYKEFRHQYINPLIERNGFEVKQEVHGRKHEDKSYFKDKMLEGGKKLQALENQLNEREKAIKGKEASANEKMQAADQAVANAEQRQADAEKAAREAENNERIAVEKMKQATLQVLDAKRKQEEAAELAKQSYAAKEEVEREIQMKQTRVEELNRKLKNKEDLIQTQDEIDEIFRQTGKGFPYPKILSKGSRGFGKNKISTVEISEKDLEELRGKAASYDTVLMQRKKAEDAAKTALEAADKDQTITEQKDQILALKMELQKYRVERDQAVRKQHDIEFDRNEALDYIARKGLGEDFVDEYSRDQGHHHHIRH